jgi:NitT/TauT family transport system substrate-binding protein
MRARIRSVWQIRWRIIRALPFILLLASPEAALAHERVRFGATLSSMLIWIAQEKGYFQKHGIRAETQMFSSGRGTLDALVKDEVDLANASDFAFNSRVGTDSGLRILASTSVIRTARLIGRRDRGISDAGSLAGKRVGVTHGTVGEFFLSRYLTLYGVDIASVTLVDLKPEAIAQRLVEGTLDAGIAWDPFITDAEDELNGNVVLLPGQIEHFYFFLLITTQGWAEKNPRLADGVLRSLIEAENFSSAHGREAMQIIQKKWGYRNESMDRLWPLHTLHVSLPQALIFNLEVQANWGMKKKALPVAALPKFLDHVLTEPLAALRPSSVGIVK